MSNMSDTLKATLKKNNLLAKLEPYLNIADTEKQNIASLFTSSKTTKKYFETLNKIKKMETVLKQLDKFDNFWNSGILWSRTVDKIVLKMKHRTEQLEGEIILRNRDMLCILAGENPYNSSLFATYY